MAASWKTVRVFISSTFRDMNAERDHLVRVVFPELKERCRKIHVHVIDVDLRWGVTEADAEHGKALDICLDEIDSCRPYFLGILGHRYGFIPEGHRHSITAQEIYHGVLHGSVPKQVVDLRKILEEKLEGQTLSKEQKDCLARCYRWDADKRKHLLLDGVTPQDSDIIRSVFERYSIFQKDRSFFFFRSEALTRQLASAMTVDFFEQKQEDRDKLESLKKEIADAKLPYFEYADIETFGKLVLDTVWKPIEAETAQAPKERNWLAEEDELHGLFVAERTRRFVGRHELLDRMHAFCERNEEPSLLVITGEPGCGKSALMARFAEEALRRNPNRLILWHFVGASPASTSLRQMLRRLCTHLNRTIKAIGDAPEDINELLKLFPDLLTKASKQRPQIFIIDAVNQLEKSDRAHSIHWLPQELPPNVCVVISTLAGEAHDAMLRRRIEPQEETVKGLTAPEIRELVGAYLGEIRHNFPNPEVESAFYRKVEQGNPLYILVTLEELRVFGKFEELGNRINRLPDNVPALFEQALERIESDFTPALVGDCMSYIACGRYGMTAEELQTLLKAHTPQIEPNVEAPKLPDMLWRRLYRSLGAYLFERAGVIDFFHGQLKEAVGKRYLQKEPHRKTAHQAIASYLENRWREPYVRALGELPHQHMKAKNGQALGGILCDLKFIEFKCQEGMTDDLVADYISALREDCVPHGSRSGLEDFARFVFAQRHLLRRNAALTFQQAANEPDSTAPARVGRALLDDRIEKRPWFQYVNKPQSRSACLATFEVRATSCAFSPDGRHIVSGSYYDNTLQVWDAEFGVEQVTLEGFRTNVQACAYSPDGRRIIAACSDKTLKLWDTATGAKLATLEGHTHPVLSCAFSPDGRRIVSNSLDGTLKLWDTETGVVLATIKGGGYRACAFSPDGHRIVSASRDGTLKLWDAETGAILLTLMGHEEMVNACTFSPDGRRIVSASYDMTLKLWDAQKGVAVATLRGHTHTVNACAFSPDGRRIVSASDDKTLKLWDAQRGVAVATLRGLAHEVIGCAFSPDGHRIVSCSADGMKLWDAEGRTELAISVGHNNCVRACAFSPDGRRIVSASDDKTLKLWDAETGAILLTLTGHEEGVNACAFSPDGRRIVSASKDRSLKLWDATTGTEIATLRDAGKARAFSPDGQRLLSITLGPLKLWDARTGILLATLKGHKMSVAACAFSPDGRRIITFSHDHTLKLWDAETGAEASIPEPEISSLRAYVYSQGTAFAFSPDGRFIVPIPGDVTVSPDGYRTQSTSDTLRIWNAQTGAELAALKGRTDRMKTRAFSPDGRRIVTIDVPDRSWNRIPCSADYTLRLWDLETGAELATLKGHTYEVEACAFSPDGSRIVSFALDQTLKLWDAETGAQIIEYMHDGVFEAMAFNPRNGDLAAFDRLGKLLILRPQNILFVPVLVTAWQSNPRRRGLWKHLDSGFHYCCPHCSSWPEIAKSALGTMIPCPHCRNRIKLNPFTIDADWRPVAAAWKKK